MTPLEPPPSCRVFTPYELADAMVCALGTGAQERWLEPCHGQGVFLRALAAHKVRPNQIVAVDLVEEACDADHLATTRRGVDFLAWSQATTERFDGIVGNPPYVAIGELASPLRETAASIRDLNNNPVGLGANTWYAFTLACLRLLSPGGSIALILPAACEFADYSAPARAAVGRLFRYFEVYRCLRPLFDEVQDGSVVIVGRGFQGGPCSYRRRKFATAKGLIEALRAGPPKRTLRCPSPKSLNPGDCARLGEVATIRLGGVTGDGRYFLMTEQRRRELQLPLQAVTPVLSRARHLTGATVGLADWEKLKRDDQRVWLFNPSEKLVSAPAVKRYLDLSEAEGGCRRDGFKVSHRDPWYGTPLPERADAFISGMGRYGPWLCINEMPGLTATNTLYVLTFDDAVTGEERFGWALALLSSRVQRQLRRLARVYADGLTKYEPGAIQSLWVPHPTAGVPYRDAYAKAIAHLLAGDRLAAQAIADSGTCQHEAA